MIVGSYHTEITDLIMNSSLANGTQILTIRTLACISPELLCKIVGDLAGMERVLAGLYLKGWGR